MAIRKTIWSAWFGGDMPVGISKCLESQRIPGYEHFLIDEESIEKMYGIPQYVKVALQHKKYVKAWDYLRAWLLYTYGGIAMDSDVTILPGKNFNHLLGNKLFASREENGFVGYSTVGSEAGHPLWADYMQIVLEKFTPLDGKNFESSMEIFTHLMYARSDVTILSPDYFFVYNWQSGIINVTENSIALHDFYKSWKPEAKELLPFVSIIIPQLGRPEGLQRCLDSIDKLLYPRHLIEVLIEEGEDTVPIKVKRAFERSKGEVLVYAANDMTFEPISLYNAIKRNKGLVSFNEGELLPDEGNICTHFAIKRSLIGKLENKEIFSLDFKHCACDNWLWAQAKKLGEAEWCEDAKITHSHFSKGFPNDSIYDKGWKNAEQDRELLKKKLNGEYK